ncbi:MAG TPA: protein kinase [Planctomycetota bacterium]
MSAILSAEDLRRLDTLFERGAELAADEHAAFVARECGANGALARELERLLAGLVGEDVLGRLQPTAPSLAGTRVGPYQLIERVGQGGMGEVYAAEQLEPVQRRVAVKIIKPGLEGAEVVARFQAERQALARMKHPNVAQIHGGGTTEGGRPYFVMEYVEGEPITAYCDHHRLPTRARLELFLDVCAGVQHAHQKGVVHRDLKPSNLLVTREQDRPLPKVIDFGVARSTQGRLAQETLLTQLGQIVGTLEYMSPEQADPGSTDVDTRSDVYSLGVVLYQLVSGMMPFDRDSLAGLPLFEVQRLLLSKDPVTPSTRLRRQRATATSLAPLHGTDARALIRQLSGDLDWICLKALERDPARRYPSVSELAEDVQRHLRHEPVLARRPGTLYRLGKFVRRHRVGVAAAVVALVSIGLGGYGAVSGRLEARASERIAELQRPGKDASRLQQLLQRADEELWPPAPERAEAMRAWLNEAQDLLTSADDHRRALVRAREQALPPSEGDVQRERELRAELERERDEYERAVGEALEGEPSPRLDRRIAVLEARIQAAEARLAAPHPWRFASFEDQGRHDLLAGLVTGLEELADESRGLLGPQGVSLAHGWSVPRRLELAQDLRARSLEGAAAELWEEAVASLRDPLACPQYHGLEIVPQLGLLPLGRDPDSGLWEFAHLLSGEPAQRNPEGRLEMRPETGIVLVLIPGGTFRMGAQRGNARRPNHDPHAIEFQEAPPHEVQVPAFFLSKFELTVPQWWRATHDLPGEASLEDILPIGGMTWTEADRVVTRYGLALPHEEQWEYAARAGTSTIWYTGDDELSLQGHANLFDRTTAEEFPNWQQQADGLSCAPAPIDDGVASMAPVGRYAPNAFGLHDVHGNMMEWCSNPIYAYSGEPVPPAQEQERMGRGGCSRYNATAARIAARWPASTAFKFPALGLRPARALER